MKKKIKNFFTLTRKTNGGFTLVELIVVIAILAILGGVAVPAYSGYVKKADRASDEALLNEINIAFASACSLAGENYFFREDGTDLLFNGKRVESLKVGSNEVKDNFDTFFESTETEFKVISPDDILYVKDEGIFREAMMLTYMDGTGRPFNISEKDREAFVNSVFGDGTFEIGEVLGAIDGAVDFATGKVGALTNIIGTDVFQQIYKDMYGKNTSEASEEELMNAMVFYVAQNSENIKTDDVYNAILTNNGSYGYIGGTASGAEGDTQDVTMVAMHYAAGMAWAKDRLDSGKITQAEYDAMMASPQNMFDKMGKQETTDDRGNVTYVDSDFIAWMNDNPDAAKEAMNGYAGAIGMVGDNFSSIKGNELTNGFAGNSNLSDLVEDVIAGKSNG